MYPEGFQKIINDLKLLPGVGEKTAVRYAFSLLKMNEEKTTEIAEDLINLKNNITSCEICGCMCENNVCKYCNNEQNDSKIICVVEKQKDVFVFEKSGMYNCKYHVLGGIISPMDGINPEDLSINKLLKRVEEEKIEEIILALRPGIEGSTTSLYIKKILELNKNIKITQIAQGIPIGADIDCLDDLTIELALENRNEMV